MTTALFAALADPLRLRAVALLVQEGELCVCELTHALQVTQPRMSKHLAVLRDAGVVGDRRDAQWVLYAIADTQPRWRRDVLEACVGGLAGDETAIADRRRLAAMPERPRRRHAV